MSLVGSRRVSHSIFQCNRNRVDARWTIVLVFSLSVWTYLPPSSRFLNVAKRRPGIAIVSLTPLSNMQVMISVLMTRLSWLKTLVASTYGSTSETAIKDITDVMDEKQRFVLN